MHHYRQALLRMRQGDSDRDIAAARVMGRPKAAQWRLIATERGWLEARCRRDRTSSHVERSEGRCQAHDGTTALGVSERAEVKLAGRCLDQAPGMDLHARLVLRRRRVSNVNEGDACAARICPVHALTFRALARRVCRLGMVRWR